jgi:protein-disulfide isomerase
MRSRPWLAATALGIAVIGLGASVASLIDDLGATATFCAEAGCATVRASAWSHPLGIPMPVLGIAFFTAAIVLGFVERSETGGGDPDGSAGGAGGSAPRGIDAPRLRRTLALAGAAWAAALIAVQAFAVGAWCTLCLVADAAAIGYAIAVLAGAATLRLSAARGAAVGSALAAAIAGLALWTHVEPPPPPASEVPAFVQAAQVPGAATVVEVVDFECPFCRRMQDQLATAIARARPPVRVVRKMLPLAMHRHAMPAALAYCCADAQGKGDAMAAALFAAPPDELTPEGCEKLAAGAGCDLERYRRDLPAAKARVAAEMAEVRAAGVHALPTLFIGGERLEGAGASADELVALLDRAAR